jgi:purine-nucleoside phosphorylase
MRPVRDALRQAAAVAESLAGRVDVAMVLGSGLGEYADGLNARTVIPYQEIPHMPVSGVSGHAGNLVIGRHGRLRIAAMQGRVHLYEGRTAHEVAFGVRMMAGLGATTLIVTNAAGGISPRLAAGDLMAITDQLNLTGTSVLAGDAGAELGERFVDMTAAYDAELRRTAQRVSAGLGFELREGVYAGLMGPAYETPAEVRMLGALGADAVGMSTVLEVLAARQLGLRVLGISCITNMAAGLSNEPLNHQEVEAAAHGVRDRFESLLTGILEDM